MTDISVKCIVFGVTEMNSDTPMPFKSKFSPISIKLPYRHARSAEFAGVLMRKGEKPSTKNETSTCSILLFAAEPGGPHTQ